MIILFTVLCKLLCNHCFRVSLNLWLCYSQYTQTYSEVLDCFVQYKALLPQGLFLQVGASHLATGPVTWKVLM